MLLDWQSGFITFLKNNDINPDPAGPNSWNLAEWIGCKDADAPLWVQYFNRSPMFSKLRPMPGAVEFVRDLIAAGHTASVITCCGVTSAIKSARWVNLVTEFGEDAFTDITMLDLGEWKLEHLVHQSKLPGPRVFVDDNFGHAQSGVIANITSYCVRRNHNREMEARHAPTEVRWIDGFDDLRLAHLRQPEPIPS